MLLAGRRDMIPKYRIYGTQLRELFAYNIGTTHSLFCTEIRRRRPVTFLRHEHCTPGGTEQPPVPP